MGSFQGLTPKSPSSWHRSLAPSPNILRPHRSNLKRTVDYVAEGRLRKLSVEKTWATIEELARYEDEGWNDPVAPGEGSLDYENPNIEQLLGVMECKVNILMKEAISLMGRSESVFGMKSNTVYQLPSEPSRQEEFENLITNFILDQEEKVHQLEEYMCVIGSDFMQLSSDVVEKLKEEIRVKKNKFTKIKKTMRYPDTKDLEPLNGHKFSKALTEKTSFHTPKFVSPKSLSVKYVRTIFPSPPFIRESTFGFKPGRKNNQNVKSRHDAENPSPQSTPQDLPPFEEYTPPVTYPEEVGKTLGTPIEVEPLNETKLEEVGLNCNHNTPLSSREVPSFDVPEPQPLLNSLSLDVSLGDVIGPEPPIKPHSPDSSRMKLRRGKAINSFDGDDLAIQCMIGFRKYVAYFNPFLPINIITRKAYNTIMVEGLESTGKNLVVVVRDVYVFVGSFTYITDFVVLEDIGEFIQINKAEVVMGKPFRKITKLEYDCAKGLMSFNRIFDSYTFQMPRTIPRFKHWGHVSWSKIPPILVLNQRDLTNGIKNAYEKNKFMYKNCLNLGPEYQVDESMKEWLIRGHVSIHEVT
ncbi:hypothetical protein Tco_0628780 [Tanacetum coccineum]|uniref:MAK10-like protein n=1 Tax=Tanacetum coccineum TaxID=301880 RepID=A0ABQ4WRG2_9ASTR